jgi:hypothetical protein
MSQGENKINTSNNNENKTGENKGQILNLLKLGSVKVEKARF